MSDNFQFIVSYGRDFVQVDDEWKWSGNKTTSIVVPSDITVDGLIQQLNVKLPTTSPHSEIALQFKVPNMNIPPAEIHEEEDLNWYISIHKETALCVTVVETPTRIVDAAMDNRCEQNELHAQIECGPIEEIIAEHIVPLTNENATANVLFETLEHCRHDNVDIAFMGSENADNDLVHEDSLSPPQSTNGDMYEGVEHVDTSDIATNQIFMNKTELYKKLRVLALKEKFQFRVQRYWRNVLHVVCIDNNCKWMLRASAVKGSDIFMIHKIYELHTYSVDYRRSAVKHATSSIVAEHIMGRLNDPNTPYAPKLIVRDLEREIGIKISYSKARRAKEAALNLLQGTPEHNFQKLASYCHVLGEKNHRTVTHIEIDSSNKYIYFFLAFGASIRGYLHFLRRVISVDGSHLKGPYKGTLLLATAQDGNKQIYPLAWGVVDGKTNKSWKWFLSKLKDLVGDSEDQVFVSDRKKSIEKAINNLFPLSHHGYCMWHVEKNLIQRYSSASAMFLFEKAATAYRLEDFDRLMGQIRSVSPRAATYLERAGFAFWSQAHIIGNRYNIMTNNNAKSLNTMLRHARGLPITCLVEHIRSTMQRWFYDRRSTSTHCTTQLTLRLEELLRIAFESGTRLRAHELNENLTQVGIPTETYVVDFVEKIYTCGKFQVNHMSCSHATRASCSRDRSLYDLCSPYYTTEYWRCAYVEPIYPMGNEVEWNVPPHIRSVTIFPSNVRRRPGRPPTQRKCSYFEASFKVRKCSRCGRVGHNRVTCTNSIGGTRG